MSSVSSPKNRPPRRQRGRIALGPAMTVWTSASRDPVSSRGRLGVTVRHHSRIPLLLIGLLVLLVGCSSGGSSATVVRYERDWPDGYHEELVLTDDGRVTMKHGDVLERLTLTAAQVDQVRAALASNLPMGDLGDALVRTVVLANGTSHSPVRPDPGSSVALLELLLTTHSLDGAPVQGASPMPAHAMPSAAP
jgi:hypothetical protein